MTGMPHRDVRFGVFCLDRLTRELRDGEGKSVALTGKAFDTLCCLIDRRDRVVGKDELIAAIWPGRVVEENNLTQAISALRRAMGRENRCIATVSGRGYQFVAEVHTGQTPSTSVPAGPGLSAAKQSIAVLPFADMSEKHDHEYFAEGLAEALINLLEQLPQLRVIARTSSFSFKGKGADIATIAAALNVATLLEGSVRKAGNTLRVTAKLVRAKDGMHLWSQTYERELIDVFAVQDEIANAAVAALKVKLLPEQQVTNLHRTGNPDAYDHYLLGQDMLRRGRYDDCQYALLAFRRALELDPYYAPAFAGLASAQSASADFAPSPAERASSKQQALANAGKAISLAPNLADGYVIRGQIRYRHAWDWKGAEADYLRALALDPNRSDVLAGYALALTNLGRPEAALALARRATDADPLSGQAWSFYGLVLHSLRRIPEARAAISHAMELSPSATYPRLGLGLLDLHDGNARSALEHFRRAGEGYAQAGIAMAEHTLGNVLEAQAALDELKAKYVAGFSFQIAQVHAWRGEKDAALEWLGRAYEQHDPGILRLRGDSQLWSLKDDPRCAALIANLNFPD